MAATTFLCLRRLRSEWLFRAALFSAIALAHPALVNAGGGPENLFLVVNARSPASLTVANHYIHLRRIAPPNVLYLDWDGGPDACDIEAFREKILAPALQAISNRGLGNQIDYLVYSSDFPTRIDFAADLPTPEQSQSYLSGSLTSLTYLYQPVLAKAPAVYMSRRSNNYMRQSAAADDVAASHGFRSWYGWGPHGELLESGGARYLLSTMLAVTSGRGNTVGEAVDSLSRSATADGTIPKGTIYYVRNSDVRSTTREPGFAAAVAALGKLNVAAEIIEGTAPQNKRDVMGAMLGTRNVNWGTTRSTILPGAICENLTSYGGVLTQGADQTPLTEFLRYGAAGSSGTVIEPYAIPDKFPAPAIQVHYARGCTLAESYYQSVWGPYQLLIVGDPLCRPWARIPEVQVAGVEPEAIVRGPLALQPTARTVAHQEQPDRFELFVNGIRMAACSGGGTLQWDTTQFGDGYYELRVVAIEAGPIESQGERVLHVSVNNQGRTIDLAASAPKVAEGQPLTVTALARGMDLIAVYQNSHLLGKITGAEGRLQIDTTKLGQGPTTLHAVGRATPAGGQAVLVVSRPLEIEIEPPAK